MLQPLTRLPLRGQRRNCVNSPASRLIPRANACGTPIACRSALSIAGGVGAVNAVRYGTCSKNMHWPSLYRAVVNGVTPV